MQANSFSVRYKMNPYVYSKLHASLQPSRLKFFITDPSKSN